MKTINDLIKELQSLSDQYKQLPVVVLLPNGMLVDPKVKMKYSNDVPTFADKNSKVEKIVITY